MRKSKVLFSMIWIMKIIFYNKKYLLLIRNYMEHNLNKKDIEEWKENLLSIKDFQSKYPSLYTLSISEWAVLKYTDSTNEEYLLWIIMYWNISLFNDIDRYLLDGFEENALIELHTTKLEVNKTINEIIK